MTEPTTIDTGVDDIVVRLHPTERRTFDWFIDCNMATAWIGDRFRIFAVHMKNRNRQHAGHVGGIGAGPGF